MLFRKGVGKLYKTWLTSGKVSMEKTWEVIEKSTWEQDKAYLSKSNRRSFIGCGKTLHYKLGCAHDK